ncbi:MAG: DNA mismatch repair protein MutS, partial [Betaproteobacteria bacterium HGW-Betaproteobacteria-21]
MSRRSRPAATASDRGEGPKPVSPFKSLAKLKAGAQAVAADKGRKAAARVPSVSQANAAADIRPDDDDLALFQSTVAGVAPLGRQDRADIQTPRPAPLPRARDAESEEIAAPARRSTSDPLRAAYADVTPLADTGRVELATPARYLNRAQEHEPVTDKTAHPEGHLPPIVLPADADVSDPTALFQLATRGARKIDTRDRVELPTDAPSPRPLKREADEREALHESLAAPLTFEDRLDMGDEAAFLRPGLPRRVLSDLRRGRWVLQGEIDLHGLTRDEARDALARFLHASLAQGKRCIRVIHGKGLGSPGRVAILKQLSRGWLAQREEILAFCQAGPHDGGG